MEPRSAYDVDLLLVEDNPNDAELTLRALGRHRLARRVHLVKDGEEALDYMFGTGQYAGRDVCQGPRAIFLDLKLPKVSGLEVLRRLKSDPRTFAIPVVMLTSSREERDIAESYSLGVNSYIVKPVDYAKFGQAVADLGLYWLQLNEPPS